MNKNTAPYFSIIVPLHEGATAYYQECIKSVLSQSFGNFEILLQNDSPDWVPMQIDDSRVLLQTNPKNFGASITRNRALARSRGSYIIPLDADDMLPENALENYRRLLDENDDVDWVLGKGKNFGSDEWESKIHLLTLGRNTPQMILDYLYRYGDLPLHSMQGAFSRSAALKFMGWPALPRDMDTGFLLRITTQFDGIISDFESYLYRRQSMQLSQEKWYDDLKIGSRQIISEYLIGNIKADKEKLKLFIGA